MPLYEYYCRECDGAFELLRPVREAAKAQPCPVCDEDADRIVSKEWSAFIFRDGYSRRLPDDGGYWHQVVGRESELVDVNLFITRMVLALDIPPFKAVLAGRHANPSLFPVNQTGRTRLQLPIDKEIDAVKFVERVRAPCKRDF